MKETRHFLEVNLPKHIGCNHCYCGTKSVEIGEHSTRLEGGIGYWVHPVYTAHDVCCNCGNTQIEKKIK